MSGTDLHRWLMSERPQSRRQAALGRAYAGWRTFARNPLARGGLASVIGLVPSFFACITSPVVAFVQ